MNSPGGELSALKEVEEELRKMRSEMAGMRSEMPQLPEGIRLLEEHIALLGIKEKLAKKEAALLAGADSTGGESSMREQAKKESGKKSEMQHLREEHMMIYFSSLSPGLQKTAVKHYYWWKYEVAKQKASFAKAEKRKALLASKHKSARREKAKTNAIAKAKAKSMAMAKAKAMAKANEEAGNELGKILEEMMGITADEVYFRKERVLLGIQEKLAKKANNNPVKETLLHLIEYMLCKSNDEKISTNKKLAKTKDEEAGKAEVSMTEAGRQEESLIGTGRPGQSATEVVKADESVKVGSGKSSMDKEVIVPETDKATLQQLLKDMPNKFEILDPDGDDEKDEIDSGESAIEEEHMSSDGKNPSDRGEESVTVGSGKLATDQEVISPETEESVTKAEEAGKAEVSVTEAGRPVEYVIGTGRPGESATEVGKAEESVTIGTGKLSMDKELIGPETDKETLQQLLKDMPNKFEILDPDGDDENDEIDRGKSAIKEEHMSSDWKDPSDRGEESVTVGGGKLATNQQVIRPEMHYLPKGIERALLDIQEKFAKKRALRLLVKDLSDKFDITMRSTSAIEEHPSMFESDKLLIEPEDPSATDSLTRLGQCSVQDDLDHERGKSATALAKKMADEMDSEADDFFLHYNLWKSAWSETCGSFELTTLLSSMQFTHYTPGRLPPNRAASTPATLQIFSIKLAEVAGNLHWPLSVYGKVVVRDVVDHNRNFLFSRRRENSQELTQDDPFLRLIGPSRAVVYKDRVTFEIQLYVKGTTKSQDKPLITQARDYHELFGDASTVCFKNCFCTIELRVQVVKRTTQATILGVQADISAGKPYPFEYGARVTCSPLPGKSKYPEIVMVDSKDGAMLKGSDGYLHLPRDVVSVEYEGRLDVEIQAYSKSGKIVAKKHVSFLPRLSKISRGCCTIRGVEVVITVAWSRVAVDKLEVMAFGSLVQDRCS